VDHGAQPDRGPWTPRQSMDFAAGQPVRNPVVERTVACRSRPAPVVRSRAGIA
jgi:hypothetical protein